MWACGECGTVNRQRPLGDQCQACGIIDPALFLYPEDLED